MRKFYANYGPSLGRCCYTRSPFSSSLAAGVRLVVYITRCADCVYLNYLNIYPGYRLFFFRPPLFSKKTGRNGRRVWSFMTPLVFWRFTNCIHYARTDNTNIPMSRPFPFESFPPIFKKSLSFPDISLNQMYFDGIRNEVGVVGSICDAISASIVVSPPTECAYTQCDAVLVL